MSRYRYSGGSTFPRWHISGVRAWGVPSSIFLARQGSYIVGFLFFSGSSVLSSVFLDRVSIATHKAKTQGTPKAHTQDKQQDTRHTPTACAQVCFFIGTYLMTAEAIKVNAISNIQNNIYNIFCFILFIPLHSFLLINSSK